MSPGGVGIRSSGPEPSRGAELHAVSQHSLARRPSAPESTPSCLVSVVQPSWVIRTPRRWPLVTQPSPTSRSKSALPSRPPRCGAAHSGRRSSGGVNRRVGGSMPTPNRARRSLPGSVSTERGLRYGPENRHCGTDPRLNYDHRLRHGRATWARSVWGNSPRNALLRFRPAYISLAASPLSSRPAQGQALDRSPPQESSQGRQRSCSSRLMRRRAPRAPRRAAPNRRPRLLRRVANRRHPRRNLHRQRADGRRPLHWSRRPRRTVPHHRRRRLR